MKSALKKSMKFSLTIAVITFVLAAVFSVISSSILNDVFWTIGLVIVFVIVFLGVGFDMLGIAATAASEAPFHAMAAERVTGARESVIIVRNADKFASFCNDVIGDISGIVSGTASSIVVLQIANLINSSHGSIYIVLNVLLTSLVAAVTVGGKAVGKTLAIHSSTDIIFWAGKTIAFIERHTKIRLLPK
ncbi:hypothetical protein [Lentibacillus saliphilus]|uniref:hypothetical protein n=1 Tax=Lentibacillus saliphilus TaxID=2737028 RepID=UPI001C30B4EA|nr:hypothetical protein [Lentibacillus saliphilus]